MSLTEGLPEVRHVSLLYSTQYLAVLTFFIARWESCTLEAFLERVVFFVFFPCWTQLVQGRNNLLLLPLEDMLKGYLTEAWRTPSSPCHLVSGTLRSSSANVNELHKLLGMLFCGAVDFFTNLGYLAKCISPLCNHKHLNKWNTVQFLHLLLNMLW